MEEKKRMELDYEILEEVIHNVITKITQQVAKIELVPSDMIPSEGAKLCSIYTVIDGTYHTKLAFCAEWQLLYRIAENMMGETPTDEEDVKEYAKEFFNVLCGQIVSEIYRRTKAAARFQPPYLEMGHCFSKDRNDVWTVCYSSRDCEKAVLVHEELRLG